MHSGLVGGQIVYNYKAGNIVLGVEPDLDYANIKGTDALSSPNPITLEGKLPSLGTARTRLGYAIDTFLSSQRAAMAYGSTKASLTSLAPPVVTASGNKSYTYTFTGDVAEATIDTKFTSNVLPICLNYKF